MNAVFPFHPRAETTPTDFRTRAFRKIHVLLLEDRISDADMILRELHRAGFDAQAMRVESKADFVAALDPAIDIILADYSLPQFDGLAALQCVQQARLDLPFIIVTGSLGDELAARCIKAGVSDYLLKDSLERLGLAVSNALEERRLRAERKLMDEQLRQAQKMEVVGQLASGVAHDFNNMLTVIKGVTSLLLDSEEISPSTREALTQVYTAGERAESLTRQLLIFSRKRPIERESVVLNEVIDGVMAMLRRLIGENMKLELDLAPGLPAIHADVGMMEQVLVNLAVNARDAMKRGGRILIGTRRVGLATADVRDRPAARPGSFVRLSVTDAGCGIPPEILPRIFEPFFTTKEPGKGTGLGLATIFGIVEQHEGWVEVASAVGVGTTFQVFLPVAGLAVAAPAAPLPAEAQVAGGAETVLVVEDEPSVREYAVEVLQAYGYRVLQAATGVEALELWRRHAGLIDVLLTDLVMPDDVSGPELADKLKAEKPDLGLIFMSGYNQEMAVHVFGLDPAARFMQKPYPPQGLAQAVRETLDRKAA